MWGSSRQALDRSNLGSPSGNSFGDPPGDTGDDLGTEEIQRAPATPNTEDINSFEGAILRLFWQEFFENADEPIQRVFATHLLHRFGPNVSSKAVRHALLSAFSEDAKKSRLQVSGLEHSVLAMRYTQQAINEHTYVEILYAAFLMAIYSGMAPDRNLSAEDQASTYHP